MVRLDLARIVMVMAPLTATLVSWKLLMVVKVALWYELWTSLMDLCWIIFLLSDLITEQALILLHAHDEMEEAPIDIS